MATRLGKAWVLAVAAAAVTWAGGAGCGGDDGTAVDEGGIRDDLGARDPGPGDLPADLADPGRDPGARDVPVPDLATDEGPDDPGPADEGPADTALPDVAPDPGATDPGAADPGATDPGATDPGLGTKQAGESCKDYPECANGMSCIAGQFTRAHCNPTCASDQDCLDAAPGTKGTCTALGGYQICVWYCGPWGGNLPCPGDLTCDGATCG